VPVPVTNEHIKDPGTNEFALVYGIGFVFPYFLEHIGCTLKILYLSRGVEGSPVTFIAGLFIRRAFFNKVEFISEFGIKSAKRILFWYVKEFGAGMVYAGSPGKRTDCQLHIRMRRGEEIRNYIFRPGIFISIFRIGYSFNLEF